MARGCTVTEVPQLVVGGCTDEATVEEQRVGQPTVLLPGKQHNEWIAHRAVAVMGYDNSNNLLTSSWLTLIEKLNEENWKF